MEETRFVPRLNHVAMTMAPDALDAAGRADIERFYGEVFGWRRFDTDEPGDPLVLGTGAFGQFVYLLAGEPALRAPGLDHFGLQVSSVEEIDAALDRARAFRARDPRVQIIDKKSAPQKASIGKVTLTNAYVGYLLPLMVELQHIHVEPFAPEPVAE